MTPNIDNASSAVVPANSGTSITGGTGMMSMIDEVVMHPLVLLSVADHYHRVARGTRKRVVGVLLGTVYRGKIDVTNSFAVPFEEDSRNPAVFYFDHLYLENMFGMFRKVNAKERVVGFYSTGPQIRPNDLRIYDIVERYTGSATIPSSVPAIFCIVDIRPNRTELPVKAYRVIEEISTFTSGSNDTTGGTTSTTGSTETPGATNKATTKKRQVHRTFAYVHASLGAMEAEEVGVEHLLRDINDPTVSTVASLIKGKLAGLTTLGEKLLECRYYLENCANGTIPINNEIIANLQTIISLLPNLLNNQQLVRSMILKTNDMYMSIYLASLIRTVIVLHDLVNNKIRYGEDGTEYKKNNNEEEKETTTKTNSSTTTATVDEEKKDDTGANNEKDTKNKK